MSILQLSHNALCILNAESKYSLNLEERLYSLQLEASSSSFTALIANAPTGEAAYIDSGDILEESKRRAGGMKIRMQHYFKRQA